FAELVAHPLLAERLLPEQRAVHVVDEHALRFEPGVDALAVGDGGARRVRAVLGMRGFVWLLLDGRALPDGLAGLAIDREHDEAMSIARRDAAARLMRCGARQPDRYSGEQKEAVAPDDRRGGSAAGHLHFPADVLRLAPLERRMRGARDTARVR